MPAAALRPRTRLLALALASAAAAFTAGLPARAATDDALLQRG
ncbi:hypothetical protein ABXN37_04555 [Piscinibacter sakaiensis]